MALKHFSGIAMSKDIQVHKILVPVDFSPESAEAVAFAAKYADRNGCAVVLLHVIHTPHDHLERYTQPQDGNQLLPMPDLAQRLMDDFVRNLDCVCPISVDQLLVSGLPAGRILEVATLIGAREIVMGGHLLGWVEGLLKGSISKKVCSESQIPVTVVYDDGRVQRHEHGKVRYQEAGDIVDHVGSLPDTFSVIAEEPEAAPSK
jgi:nucleotide-binding universal stress UspA family protein